MRGQRRLQVDGHYTKLPTGGRVTKSPLGVDGHYTKSPTGRRMTKVAYGWTVTILSYLQVDAWPKTPMGGRSLY